MIHDNIINLSRYHVPMAEQILGFLKNNKALELDLPEIEIAGRDLFVRPASYQTRPVEDGRFEAHAAYVDLQYVVRGAEIMQTAPADALVVQKEYDPNNDIGFFTAGRDITSVVVRAGEFAVFFPGEAHRPMCQRGRGPEQVKKLVFKIRLERPAGSMDLSRRLS